MATGVETTWFVEKGSIIGPQLRPEAVVARMRELNVVADVNWHADTPHLIGLSVLVNEAEGVAALDSATAPYRPGLTVSELTADLAGNLDAVVYIGDHRCDGVAPDATWPEVVSDDSPETRVAEFSSMPAASVPFCAAVEGFDMGCVELEGNMRAVLYSDSSYGIGEGAVVSEIPCIALYASPDNYRLVAIEGDATGLDQDLITHNFSVDYEIVTGAVDPAQADMERVRASLGRGFIAGRLARIMPTIDVDALAQALRLRGEEGLRATIKALGVPAGIAAYLLEGTDLGAVPKVAVHEARGLPNALGRSIDLILQEPDSAGSQLWSTYHKVAVEKPWIVRFLATVEAAVGATLVTLSVRSQRRGGWNTLGTVVGALMVVDSIAEVSLAKYLGIRARRHAAELEPDTDQGQAPH